LSAAFYFALTILKELTFMKRFILVFSIITVSFIAGAQKTSESATGVKFGGGLRVGLPLGDFGDSYSLGIGAELQAEYMFTPTVSGTFTTGYTNFIGKSESFGGFTFKNPSLGLIPILVGARVYPAPDFFIGGKLGLGIFTGSSSSSTGFSYEPQVGYNAEKFQFSLGYNGWSKNGGSLNHLGLTGIYKFN
jgi:hypothetical protein